MLLNELTGVKRLKTKSATEILSYLKKQYGITMKSGAFGVVLVNPKWDHVIKFFPKDDAYLKFVDYCVKHPNEHLPTFKKMPMKMSIFFRNSYGDKPSHEGEQLDKFYAVKIEKLTPLTDEVKQDLRVLLKGKREAIIMYEDASDKEAYLKDFGQGQDFSKYKEIMDLLVDLKKFEAADLNLDIHAGNFMMRGNTIVITDPFADSWILNNITLDRVISDVDMRRLSADQITTSIDDMARAFTVPAARDSKSTLPMSPPVRDTLPLLQK